MSIEKIVWNELMEKKGKKSYIIRKEYDYLITLSAKVVPNTKTFVSKKTVYQYSNSDDIDFDELGRPFYWLNYGKIRFPYYSESFLGNTCFAEGMGNAYDGRLEQIYTLLKLHSCSKIVFEGIHQIVEDVISKSQKIKEATIKAVYGDQEDLLKYDYSELDIFTGLFVEDYGHFSLSENKKKYLRNSLPEKFSEKPKINEINKHDLFKEVFPSYLIKNDYKKKIKESEKRNEEEYKSYIKKIIQDLEKRGFKLVDRLF
ncbi:hypothetical protein HYV79_03530 [Candidatus Woesearchaeota archaeon]|nr:hypothetical protein [Candidatus Woesearchaeota archaeon]